MPQFSIIVPYHNAGPYLARCVESLLSQSVPRSDYEIFLVDNGSSDGSASIAARYDGVHRLIEPKRGAYVARNRALRVARGDIIAFTDSDCEVHSHWLESILQAMREPRVGIVFGRTQYAADEGFLPLLSAYEAEKIAYVTGQPNRERHYGYANNMAVRRDVFDRLGLFPELNRGADVILLHRVIEAQGPEAIRHCPEALVRHLEIVRLRDFYRKQLIYGRSTEYVSRLVAFRPLNQAERLEIFRRTVQRNRYTRYDALKLFILLAVGGALFQAAWWRARCCKLRSREVVS